MRDLDYLLDSNSDLCGKSTFRKISNKNKEKIENIPKPKNNVHPRGFSLRTQEKPMFLRNQLSLPLIGFLEGTIDIGSAVKDF